MATSEKICDTCGKKFTPSHHLQKYCSVACNPRKPRGFPKPRVFPKRKCGFCGEEFTPTSNTQIYCSVTCRVKYNRANKPKVLLRKKCPCCEEEFLTVYGHQKYCSEQCFKIMHLPPKKAPDKPRKKKSKSTLDETIRRADECGLSYGHYVALLRQGYTYEQLKAQVAEIDLGGT